MVLFPLMMLLLIPQRYEFSSKSQPLDLLNSNRVCCCWYHKGTNFQANHNKTGNQLTATKVVADTTKVRIFKQITTSLSSFETPKELLLIPQRYEFSSKSQLTKDVPTDTHSCCWYHKGTNFQANHNEVSVKWFVDTVVADTTKVRIFKQITTYLYISVLTWKLLLIPQRYEFSSKSQHKFSLKYDAPCCCWYHKGTNFQANHNTCYR